MTTVIFFGTPQFAVPPLEALCATSSVRGAAVVTQPDRPTGRGGIITPPPVKLCAVRHNIPVFQPQSLRRDFSSLRQHIDQLGPFDIGIVVAFGQILPPDVLAFPRAGCVNIHASILPRWRGAAPIQRAIEAGDSETGVCLMQMDEGLDTGNVYSMTRVPISATDTYTSMHDKLSDAGAKLLARDLQSIVEGSLVSVPQQTEGISYAKKITSEESRIDWTCSSVEIARKIRAFSPTPGCYSLWNGKRLKILRATYSESDFTPASPPGTILQSFADTVSVQCGHGAVRLEEVQLEGKRKMSLEEFLRGSVMMQGSRLL